MTIQLFIFVIGLMIGSFLNVCIYRLPQGGSVVSPPSCCGSCGRRLSPLDLIPVLSYLILSGRCRYCGAAISARYAAVELLTAVLFVWCLLANGLGFGLVRALVLTAFLLVVAFIDYDHQLILDKVLLWMAAAGMLINLLSGSAILTMLPFTEQSLQVAGYPGVLYMIIAALAGGGIMLLIAIVSAGGMGGGDIKFTAVLGLWFGWKLTMMVLMVSFMIGGATGALLLILRFKKRKDFIPFGPFIAIAAFLVLLYGRSLLGFLLI